MTIATQATPQTKVLTRKDGREITFFRLGCFDVISTHTSFLRVELDRSLTLEEGKRLLNIIEYAYKCTVAGRLWRTRQSDGGNAVWVRFPVSTSPRSDVYNALIDFVTEVERMVVEGTPIRNTTSAWGRRGTRLVEGFGSDVEVSIWTDKVDFITCVTE